MGDIPEEPLPIVRPIFHRPIIRGSSDFLPLRGRRGARSISAMVLRGGGGGEKWLRLSGNNILLESVWWVDETESDWKHVIGWAV